MFKLYCRLWIPYEFFSEGTNLNPAVSIVAISDNEIIARAEKIVISLGKNGLEASNSVKQIKTSEMERTVFILKKLYKPMLMGILVHIIWFCLKHRVFPKI